jgi:hypothetical protein
MTQDGAVAARLVHTQEVEGSSPSPAPSFSSFGWGLDIIFHLLI